MNDRGGRLAPMAAMGTTCLLWGTMVPFSSVLMDTLDPMFLAPLRYSMGVVSLLFLVVLTERRLFHRGHLPLGRVLALGGAGMAAWATLYSLGIYYSDPITAAAALATGPVVAALVGRVLNGERMHARLAVGVALAVIGGIVVALGKPGAAHPGRFQGGEVILVVALVCWTWYSIKAQHWLAPLGLSQVRLTLWTASAGCFWIWLIYLAAVVTGLAPPPAPLAGAEAWTMLAWIGFGGSGLAIWFWNFGASRVGTTVATININLVPVIAVLTSAALGIYPSLAQVVGGVVVLAGVAVVQFAGRAR